MNNSRTAIRSKEKNLWIKSKRRTRRQNIHLEKARNTSNSWGIGLGALWTSNCPHNFWETSSCLFLSDLPESTQMDNEIITCCMYNSIRYVTESQTSRYCYSRWQEWKLSTQVFVLPRMTQLISADYSSVRDIVSWLTIQYILRDAAGFLESLDLEPPCYIHLSPLPKSQKPLEWLTGFSHQVNYSFNELAEWLD